MLHMSFIQARTTRTAIAGAILAMALVAPPALARSDNSAAAVVSTAVDRTTSALQDANISDAEADQILELIDLERVAQFTLGKHWRAADDASRAAFNTAFRDYARVQLREHLSGFADAKVEVVRTVERQAGDAIVVTNVTGVDSKQHVVSWRVHDRQGWKISDIEVSGLWFAIEQRAQFQAVLDQNGGNIEDLISRMATGF